MYSAKQSRYTNLNPRHAGTSGLVLPPVSLGLWRHFGSDAPIDSRRALILHAFDQGVFHFDCANNYGNDGSGFGSAETTLGQVLANDLKPYRDELVISTKAGYPIHDGPFGTGTSRKAMIQGLNDSLRRLHTDYVDIFYAHRFDETTPIEETVLALDATVKSGKALYVGISNFETTQAQAAIKLFQELHTPFVLDQMSYNLLNRHVETTGLLDALRGAGAGLIAYGPLSEGLLSDRYLQGIPADFRIHHTNKGLLRAGKEALVAKLNALNQIAQNRHQTLSQMALSWLLKDEVVTSVIIGTTNPDHLDDNIAAANNINFSPDELQAIDDAIK